ncbi:hypothetical protein L228DRAFT_262764 [Xylona heveae TC161]|uniref:RWD domain-containing protein n=1 Tax=Xylona heveae (strain CBS 132557 / TC161) TaxID=1328760 RepID=A0A161U3G1_XYLHT|nr:hypothetical protein L228DRAFT_262764 [Xylona heveae TC161]KZF20899.1 hypothetical protein L228DRAFT_262764 [Xylona heveae TC161]
MARSQRHNEPQSPFESETFNVEMSLKGPQAVGSMSISPCGRDVVLASREGLHVIDLDSPYSPPRYLPHHTPWEVADVQWSPFAVRDYWVVSTSNQKALVWNLGMASDHSAIEHVLHGHSRAITDINFSAFHPDLLATCAVDSFVHCWDLRRPARPAMTFCDWFAGATQVRWNRQDSHIIASSHDKYLHIWDDRKGAYPLKSIEAHETKIYGVDWNRTRSGAIATCSLDKTIKFWDYTSESASPERVIDTPFPVWRARHTPFGCGLLAMPQRGNSDLHLYDRRLAPGMKPDDAVPEVHKFEGHAGQVKEFLWRPRGGIDDGIDNREFQLISWGTDREVRLHRVDPEILRSVGYEKGKGAHKNIYITRKDAVYRSYRDVQADHEGQRGAIGNNLERGLARGALSAGMGKVPIPAGRGWVGSGYMTSKAAIHGMTSAKKDSNPITWMKGVKIGKEKAFPLPKPPNMTESASSLLSPGFRGSGFWEGPETLGDEVTYVGDKFSKVTFDKVDIQNRTVTISMNGPWGSDGKVVYVKVEIKFPHDYPGPSAPSFKLEKTSSLAGDAAVRMSRELRTIAASYASRGKGCLEAVLCYLLGERKLEESTIWLGPEETEDGINVGGQGESSSDEEVDVGDFHDMEMSGNDLLGPANLNANVPLPKACGAIWSETGRLICFFPPKEDKTKSLLSAITLRDHDRLSGAPKFFEGFGRLRARSPGPKNKMTSINEDEEASDSSDDSLTSFSDSESMTSTVGLPSRFQPPMAWHGKPLRLQRINSTDLSQKSSAAGTLNTKTEGNAPKSVISIHNLEDLLPAKKELAMNYALFGDGPEVCAHNSKVAAEHGAYDIADIWEYIGLVLYNEVPLEIMPQPHRREHVLVLAKRGVSRARQKPNSVETTPSERSKGKGFKFLGRVRWGKHPFGGSWFVEELFKYFEKLADVQMLAMLSCIFCEPEAKEAVATSITKPKKHEAPLFMKTPAFSLDYFAAEEVAWSLFQPSPRVASNIETQQSIERTYGSANSSNGLWGNDPIIPYSTGTTPPHRQKSSRAVLEPPSQTQSVSTSPEQQHARRSNSNLASVFAASFARPFSSNVAASSPPSQTRKRPSPNEPFSGATTGQGISRGGTATLGKESALREEHRNIYSHLSVEGSDTEQEEPAPKKLSVKVSLKNQNLFDDESRVPMALLNPSQQSKCRGYREAYANLLYIWGLRFSSCEVLKFNMLRPYFSTLSQEEKDSLMALGKRASVDQMQDRWMGLELGVNCTQCEDLLPKARPGSPASRCQSCESVRKNVCCSICQEIVRGLFTPCLSCGHVTHSTCHAEWFAAGPRETVDGDAKDSSQPETKEKDKSSGRSNRPNGSQSTSSITTVECAAGCGCLCPRDALIGRDIHASNGDLLGDGRLDTVMEEDPEWSDDPWEKLAVAALGRGVGGGLSRGLSQSKGARLSLRRSSSGFIPDEKNRA